MILCLAGCLGPRVNWQQRIGTYTFDQAVQEMGPPEKSAVLTDGTRVAEWLLEKGQTGRSYNPFFFDQSYYYGPFQARRSAGIEYYSGPQNPDYYIRLIFEPSGRLREWKNITK